MGNAIEISDSNFKKEVLDSSVPVLMDCWATWCAPCRMIAPMIDELAVEYAGRAKVVKLDVDSNPTIAMNFGIRSIPTLLFFKGGRVVNQLVGALPKDTLVKHLDEIL